MDNKNAVLIGLEHMKQYDLRGDGAIYAQDGTNYTVDEMIKEIEAESEIGNVFTQNVYDMVLTYLGKFSQDAK